MAVRPTNQSVRELLDRLVVQAAGGDRMYEAALRTRAELDAALAEVADSDTPSTGELLDRATAGREIATVAALVLLQADGDAEAALAILDDLREAAPHETVTELDAIAIASQAIRDASGLRGDSA